MNRSIMTLTTMAGAGLALTTLLLASGCPLEPIAGADAVVSSDSADPALPACGDGVCEGEEADLCPEDCFAAALCSVVSGTPTLGICKDNGCAKSGGVCKAKDTDKDGIWDACHCQKPAPAACGDGVCEGEEADLCPEDCFAAALCSVVSGTPTLGICKDNGCAKSGGVCKAKDTDKDGIWDACHCQKPAPAACGDGVCEGEEADLCPEDCLNANTISADGWR